MYSWGSYFVHVPKGLKYIHLEILAESTIFFNDIHGVRKPSRIIKTQGGNFLLYFLWETELYTNRQIGNL